MSEVTLLSTIKAVTRREWQLSSRNPAASLNAVSFFILVAGLFGVGLGPQSEHLQQMAPGIIWVIALLATMLAVDALFREDYSDGSLEQQLLGDQPLYFALLCRLLMHSFFLAIPLAIVSPFLGVMLGLPAHSLATLAGTLLLGVPSLVFIGAIGAALTVGFERGGLLLAVLVLPLYVPVLIFAIAALQAAVIGTSIDAQLAILLALLLVAASMAPLAIEAALKLNYYY